MQSGQASSHRAATARVGHGVDPGRRARGDPTGTGGQGRDGPRHLRDGVGRCRDLQAHPPREVVDAGDLDVGQSSQGVLDPRAGRVVDVDDDTFSQLAGQHRRLVECGRHGVAVGADEAARAEQGPAEPPRHDGHDVGQAATAKDVEHRGARRAGRFAVVVAALRSRRPGRARRPCSGAGRRGCPTAPARRTRAPPPPTTPAPRRRRTATASPRSRRRRATRGSGSGVAGSAAYLPGALDGTLRVCREPGERSPLHGASPSGEDWSGLQG